MKHLLIFLILPALILSSCTKNQKEAVTPPEANLASGEHDFVNYMESIRNEYRDTDKVIAVEFNFMNDDNIQIKGFSELSGIEATLALATSNIDLKDASLYSKSGGCSKKDVSKGNCYQISCHSNGGTTTSRCTGGAFGSCLGIGKGCLEAGGCVEVCKVPPRVYYVPPIFAEDPANIENEIIEIPEQFHFFPGED